MLIETFALDQRQNGRQILLALMVEQIAQLIEDTGRLVKLDCFGSSTRGPLVRLKALIVVLPLDITVLDRFSQSTPQSSGPIQAGQIGRGAKLWCGTFGFSRQSFTPTSRFAIVKALSDA